MRRLAIGPILLASGLFAGPALDDDPATEAARASAMAAGELKLWEIRTAGDPVRIARARPDPILRYSNPGVGRVYGDVFLFIADGRPEAVMAIYKWFTPWTGFEAEMHSLSTSPLDATRDGKAAWQPERPGLKLEDVPDAPSVANSAADRASQMRTIAGQFSGKLLDARVAVGGEDQALRLLPKPLYRYEPRDASLKDGALFAFVLGTDPEIFLLLEARETPQGLRWQYGLARMNNDPLQASFKGKVVWKAEKVAQRRDSHAAYFSIDLPKPKM